MRSKIRWMRFLPAVAVSVALVLAGPAIGQVRSALLAAFPSSYRLILLSVVLAVVLTFVTVALVRIRERRAMRFACLAAALVIATSYSWVTSTGDASVDAVERFHFVEYGLITLLFYRAWLPAGNGSVLVLPVLAAHTVGICEEWLQWFVPARVGEVRDVVLNLWAIGCGLLLSIALDPPPTLTLALSRASWSRVKRFAAFVFVVFALFFHSVHLGYRIDDGEGGMFRSYYTSDGLARHAQARVERWRADPPMTWSRYSREDQYFSEGIVHVRARNRCFEQGEIACAWRENAILERYYAPILDAPSYVSAIGHRWSAEQRHDAEQRRNAPAAAAPADRDDSIIYTWSKPIFWVAIALAVGALLLL